MRTQQRSFVVEIKSARRRLKTQPKSIWGDTDFEALIRDTEATLPFMQNAVSEASVNRGNLQFALQQQIEVADLNDHDEEQPGVMPLTDSDQIEWLQQEDVSIKSDVSKVAFGKSNRQTARTAKHRRIRRATIATEAGVISALASANTVVEAHYDELISLDAENLRLKQLLTEHLAQQNVQLRQMLKRFE